MTRQQRSKSGKRAAAGAAGRADELAAVKRELREALDRQAATNEILHLISSSPDDTQPIFDAIVKSGSRLFPGSAISVALPMGDVVDAAAIADEDPARAEAWRRRFPFPLTRDYMHGVAILDKREIAIPDVANSPTKDTPGARNFLASGYRAVTMMPMVRDDKAIGVISVVRINPGTLSDEQTALLRAFASQAVIAIENARMVGEMKQTNETLANVSHQLARYVSPQLYQSIVDGAQDVTINAQRKKLTVFFSDIVGFAEITDRLEPEELTALLNEYLKEMSAIAEVFGATFDKFIGDAIMCFFGDPTTRGVAEDAEACVRMALAMRKRLQEMQRGWRKKGLIDRPFEARMGINTGYCTVGNFGSRERMDYTIIGHEVNLAARLEASAEPGGILMAAQTYSQVREWLQAEEQEPILMKGFADPVRTYRVIGAADEAVGDPARFTYEDDGVAIAIDGRLADKAKARAALKKALDSLDP